MSDIARVRQNIFLSPQKVFGLNSVLSERPTESARELRSFFLYWNAFAGDFAPVRPVRKDRVDVQFLDFPGFI